MNNTVLVVLGVVVVVVILSRAEKKNPEKAPANAQTAAQPDGQQNAAPGDTFADVANAMSRVFDSAANVVQTFTQRN